MPAAARNRLSIIPSHSFHGAGMLRNQMSSTGPTIPTATIGSNQRRVAKPPTRRPMIAETTTRAVSTVGPGVVVNERRTTTPTISGQIRTISWTSRWRNGSTTVSRPVIARICWTYPARTPP